MRENERILHVDLVLSFKVHSPAKLPKPVLVTVEITELPDGHVASQQNVHFAYVGWRKFAISRHLMASWLQRRDGHVELMLRARAAGDSAALYPDALRVTWQEGRSQRNKPMLVVHCGDKSLGARPNPKEPKLRRFDRGARRNDMCRRERMTVDFAKLGWNSWVIAPPSYAAYRCTGQCSAPIGGQLNPTTHAIFQSTIADLPGSDVDDPCCVPIKLSGISLLYYDTKYRRSISLKLIQNMVVEECGCRWIVEGSELIDDFHKRRTVNPFTPKSDQL